MQYQELIKTANLIAAYIGQQQTKGQKKLFKIYEKLKPSIDEYQAKLEELRLDNAAIDDKGHLVIDEKGNYKFNKEAIKNLNKQIKDLNETNFDFKVIDVLNPDGLEDYWFLEGWINGVTFNKPHEETIDL